MLTATAFTANTIAAFYTVTGDSAGSTTASFSETNLAGNPAHVVVSAGGGQTATVGTSFATPFGASVIDQYGNPVANAPVTFRAPGSGASGSFLNGTVTTTSSTNASGIATATAFTANTIAAVYTVTGDSAGSTTVSFSETNLAGNPAHVVVSAGGGQTATVGTSFATPFGASVIDQYGNPVANAPVTFRAPASGASGSFLNGTVTTTSSTNASGIATATAFTANTIAAVYTVTGDSAGSTTVSFSETNLAGNPAHVVVSAGGGQSTTVGTSFAAPFGATVEDQFGNPVLVANIPVTFTAPAGSASGSFFNGTATTTANTNTSGIATATAFTANTAAGVYTVTGASSGSTSASFGETNVAGTASQLVATAGAGQSASVATAFTSPFSATLEDFYGNPVLTGVVVTFAAPASGASGTFVNGTDTTTVTTNPSGVATATVYTANVIAGTYAVSATSSGSTMANFSATNVAFAAPGVPIGLSATLGNTTVALTWTTPSTNGGSSITGYSVFEGTTVGGESATALNAEDLTACVSSGSPRCTVTHLVNGTAYYFTVKAWNAVGPSVASNGASAIPTSNGGYDLAAADGGLFALGHAGFFGSIGGKTLIRPIVGTATTPDGGGYWLVASDGGVFSFGNAPFYGSVGGKPLARPMVGMSATPDGGGYWLVASDGGVFSFGDARFYGSEGGRRLNKPVVGMAADPTTGGYWLVASDGGIFSFNAAFSGSLGGTRLNKPIVGMAADPTTAGYWLVASDGGVFSFNAAFAGSLGATHLNKPIVGMAADAMTGGYWLVASDGGIFSFNAAFSGSLGGTRLIQPIVGMAAG